MGGKTGLGARSARTQHPADRTDPGRPKEADTALPAAQEENPMTLSKRKFAGLETDPIKEGVKGGGGHERREPQLNRFIADCVQAQYRHLSDPADIDPDDFGRRVARAVMDRLQSAEIDVVSGDAMAEYRNDGPTLKHQGLYPCEAETARRLSLSEKHWRRIAPQLERDGLPKIVWRRRLRDLTTIRAVPAAERQHEGTGKTVSTTPIQSRSLRSCCDLAIAVCRLETSAAWHR
jgi:hypothetical protein